MVNYAVPLIILTYFYRQASSTPTYTHSCLTLSASFCPSLERWQDFHFKVIARRSCLPLLKALFASSFSTKFHHGYLMYLTDVATGAGRK